MIMPMNCPESISILNISEETLSFNLPSTSHQRHQPPMCLMRFRFHTFRKGGKEVILEKDAIFRVNL